jgi:hypothetical protein
LELFSNRSITGATGVPKMNRHPTVCYLYDLYGKQEEGHPSPIDFDRTGGRNGYQIERTLYSFQ